MVIGCCQLELHLPACTSLKDKRRVLASLRDRLRNRHNVSFAEVEHQDLWQRARVAVVSVNTQHAHLESTLDKALGEAEAIPDLEVAGAESEYL